MITPLTLLPWISLANSIIGMVELSAKGELSEEEFVKQRANLRLKLDRANELWDEVMGDDD